MQLNDRVKLVDNSGGFGGLEFIPAGSIGSIIAVNDMPNGKKSVNVKMDNYTRVLVFLLPAEGIAPA